MIGTVERSKKEITCLNRFSNHRLSERIHSSCCFTRCSQTTKTTMAAHLSTDCVKPQSGRNKSKLERIPEGTL